MVPLCPLSRLCQAACRSMDDQGWRRTNAKVEGVQESAWLPWYLCKGACWSMGSCVLICSGQLCASGLTRSNAALYCALLTQLCSRLWTCSTTRLHHHEGHCLQSLVCIKYQ